MRNRSAPDPVEKPTPCHPYTPSQGTLDSQPDPAALRVVVGGASGLIGSELIPFLSRGGHRVQQLVRRSPAAGTEIPWYPERGEIDAARLQGADAIIHLGGASIAAGRWTAARKALLRDSRVVSTRLLSETLARLQPPPKAFLCASAIGYYGDRGDELLDETSPPGRGFLPEVCVEWEAATEPARRAGLRVVNLRSGVVLSPKGGVLGQVLTPFRSGLGGVVGSGRQYMSWIGLADVLGVIQFLLSRDDIAGPVNVVAPQPVTNREFTKTLGRVLRRPTLVPLPASAVELLMGQMGRELLLAGCRVQPRVLQQAGFEFCAPRLEDALRRELRLGTAP